MSNIKLFEHKKIRSHWDAEEEKWYFSITDIVGILTESVNALAYWRKLKERLKKEGNETVTNCHALKMEAADGKLRLTDVADTEQLFRLIQSIPSPKAEPFKQWLAKTGYERIEESQDPEKSIDRAMENYMQLGYSKEWINQRLKSIEVRKELTDEWESRGVKKGQEFAVLTDVITQAWSGKTVKQYKQHKNLKKENLRDNMTNLELVLNMLAEATTAEISKEKKPINFIANKAIAKQGGVIAGNTRKAIEAKTGKQVVNSQNAKKLITNKAKKK
ncbi:BRO-N domain-containing protein [Ferruginibacter sp.]|nr:Bro-N domain-containing protein [Ferruginibacter sp.]